MRAITTVFFLMPLAASAAITPTDRGAIVETDTLRAEIRNGTLVALHNRLTGEQYLDTGADLSSTLPHLPSGLGTQHGDDARRSAEKLYHWPWWEHPNNLYLPNQYYADAQSRCEHLESQAAGRESRVLNLTYTGLTDGRKRYAGETFTLSLEIDAETGDLLVTPGGTSPRPGVYAANLSLAPLAPAITAETPITGGVRIKRSNTGQVLWVNQWPGMRP